MDQIRCLIADIPQIILADIVQKIIDKQPEIDVLGLVEERGDLVEKIKNLPVDVVICSIEEDSFRSLDEIFEVLPKVAVVGLMNDGRRVFVCMEDIGPSELISLIRAAITGNKRE